MVKGIESITIVPEDQFLREIANGNPIKWRDGQFELENWLGRAWRWILPGYARQKDLETAQRLTELASQNLASLNRDSEIIKVCEMFQKHQLSSYVIFKSTFKEVNEKINSLMATLNISKQFNIPVSVLQQNPGFTQFIYNNHLHRRLDSSYQKRNCGITVENGQICMKFFNPSDPSKPISKPWHEMPMNSSKTIQGMELFAYGWEAVDANNPVKLKPLKIIDASEAPLGAVHTAEINTAVPSYQVHRIYHAPFGHTYIKFYEPIVENGIKTDKVAVYIFGYGFGTVVSPDITEYTKRDKVKTAEKITQEQFDGAIRFIKNILLYQKNPSAIPEGEREKVAGALQYFRKTTCVNFASYMFEESTGIHLDGRFSFLKKFGQVFRQISPTLHQTMNRIWQKLPFGKYSLYLPIPMIDEQRKWNAKQLSK